jgi:4-amino-4-deoxy-L-arabinose transferase-like glycosyltransferase
VSSSPLTGPRWEAHRPPVDAPDDPAGAASAAPVVPFWLAAAGVILLGFFIREFWITTFPLFADEVTHIQRARLVLAGDVFVGLSQQKWLHPVVIAALRPTGPETVFVARIVSALAAMLTLAGIVALGRMLFGRSGALIGLLAALIYAVLPMAVFHERQALADPLMVSLLTLVTVLTVRLAARPRVLVAALLGLLLAASYLTKALALPFLALPFAGALILPRRWGDRGRALAWAAASAIAAVAVVVVVMQIAALSGPSIAETHQVSGGNTLLSSLSDPWTQIQLRRNAHDAVEALALYFGFAVVGLAALIPVWIALGREVRAILFLSVPGIAFMAVPLIVEPVTGRGYMPPRYLLPNTPGIVLLAAASLILLLGAFRASRPRAAAIAGLLIAAEILLPSLTFDYTLIRVPRLTPFTAVDEDQYFNLINAAGGQAIAQFLLDEWEDGGRQPLYVVGPNPEIEIVSVYLGPRVGVFDSTTLVDAATIHQRISAAVDAGQPVFVLCYGEEPESQPCAAHLDTERAGNYDTLHLLRVTHVD